MLAAAGVTGVDPAEALADGRAMDVWNRMIAAQGGDPHAELPVARETEDLVAEADGVRRRRSTRSRSASRRGGSAPAARARRTRCRPAPASCCTPSRATPSGAGEPLLTLHTDTPERFARAREALDGRGGGRRGRDGRCPGRRAVALVLDRIAAG